MSYKSCAVPGCTNTTIKTPAKLFVTVPKNTKVRNKWFQLASRNPKEIRHNTVVFFCQDHFDLPYDMDNYMEYHIMGSVSKIRMKPGCLPTKFECQADRSKRASGISERPYTRKKQRQDSKESIKDLKESSVNKPLVFEETSLCSDASGDPVVSASTSNQPVQSNEKQLITRETRTEHNETYENLADNRQIMVKIEDEEILEKIQNSINYETKTVPQHVEDKVKTDRPRRTQVRKNVLEVTNVVCGSKRKKEVTLKRKVICSPKVYQNALATKVDTIIARVYHFFKKEYDFLAKKYGKLLDLTPFSKHKERTAQATGFHINVVEKAVAEVVKKPGKKPKKKKRKKNIKKIEVEDNSETETGDETFGSGEEMANPAAEPSLTKELRAARKLRSLRDHSYALPISECPDVTPKVEPIEQLSEPNIGLPSEDTSSVNETSTLTSALPETDPLKIEDSFEDTEYLLEDLADIKEEIEFSDEGFS
ncbi:uncharacterized protein LOC113505464 isoform X8 [Trichoplusia ni]|uniref:Uncharacterized protein LOC113505464 isoform X8 n=1 Tax=Trichoplusia ni TaxID=7111 RepID=A0A7E5WUZ5_TRINI|nr:uncharacterized protein LOC113505464 isoform X8 [Trichoplusia ni]